jgi:hypothetical protein
VRIPFPERIPIDRVMVFAVLLFLIQILEGTPLYFSAGCVAFIVIAALAFNTAGGLTRASGAYVFFYSVLVVIVGVCYKALLGEPADSNLLDPQTDIAVYVGGMAAMLGAVTLSRRFSRKSGLLQHMLKDSDMYRSSVGCIAFGVVGASLIGLIGSGASQLNSAFTQLNELIPLGIIIGVIYEIRRSGSTRSINAPVALAIVYVFIFFGLLAFSKQGMLLPLYCWLLPVCAMRFRLSSLQVASCLLGTFILFQYLVPYAQYGRRYAPQTPGFSQRLDVAFSLLEHPEKTRQLYEGVQEGAGGGYFNTPQGFWDRLNFVAVDDGLINITDQGRIFGFSPIPTQFANAVPHFIWRDKPVMNYGNIYAHEIGGLPEEDTTTGISFSPTAEAYHMGKWVGIFVAAPLVWTLLFIVLDSLLGDLRTTPWGLLAMAMISHTAPETAITGAIYLLTFGTEIYIFCAIFATWVAPIFAIAVLGRERRGTQRQISFRSSLVPQKDAR